MLFTLFVCFRTADIVQYEIIFFLVQPRIHYEIQRSERRYNDTIGSVFCKTRLKKGVNRMPCNGVVSTKREGKEKKAWEHRNNKMQDSNTTRRNSFIR